MGNYYSNQRPKRPRDTDASSPTPSKKQRHGKSVELQAGECESESPLLLSSSDSLKKIDVPSASRANSDLSASSSSENGNNYYVFLSFRGPDTRKGFVDHLYQRLKAVGLRCHPNFVFRDDEDLPLGEKIGENLISAIERSKVSIPVISENYAYSEWCLRELIHIMKCKESRGQMVLPVLYKVTPKDVRHLEGSFGKAFESCKDKFEEEVKQQGPLALRKAVDLRVFESEKFADGREGELVNELVEKILLEQRHDFQPHLPEKLVAIEDRVTEVMELVDLACLDTRIIGIWGMGGIGKTTLATMIYNKLFGNFRCRSSLKDIRETAKSKGMEHVQSLLISDIRKVTQSIVRDPEMGIDMIRSSCENKKVLILLDDVDHQDHLNKLIGRCNFGSGSRIIITCRDKAILESKYKMYELKEMNRGESMLLFSRYAFEGEQPPTDLAALSSNIVATTGGLPLALMLIGSLLKGKDRKEWEETLEKLRNAPHKIVKEKLRISYDTLEYEEQQMFLDIACFFIGIDKTIATHFWADRKFFPRTGLQILINRSLIKIDDKNRLRMHDQLRDLGIAIACPAAKKPWEWSRLWDEEGMTVLRRKKENSDIEALCLDENGSKLFMSQRSFKMMPDLKFLHLSKVDFVGNFEDSLSELRWLQWEKCPNSFRATNVHLEKLLILDLSYGYISNEWRGWSSIKMERLKVLNLSHCIELVRTPNLSAFKSLEILILEYCNNLEEIDPSIGNANCLTSLNLSYCCKLKKLPSQLGELKHLSFLKLSSCRTLEELPKEMGEWEKLRELTMDDVLIKEIPSLIDSLTKLEILDAQFCMSLVGLPSSISHLVNLSTLDLRWCEHFKELPESIGSLVKLQRLLLGNMLLSSEANDPEYEWDFHNIDWFFRDTYWFNHIPHSIGKLKSLTELHWTCAPISELPESIGDLKFLKILKIAGCKELIKLPSTLGKLGKLEELDATACKSLEGAIPINGLSSLKILKFGKLGYAVELYDMYMGSLSLEMFSDLSSQRHLDLINCDFPVNLTVLEVTCQNHELPQLSHLIHLKRLSFQFCKFLKSIPVLPSRILKLCVIYCGKLEKLPSLLSLESLLELDIRACDELMEIEGLEGLKSLGILFLCECKKLLNLNGLEHLESLTQLDIEDLDPSLMDDRQFQVQRLGGLKNLERLRITCCQSLTRLDISQLTDLRELVVYECEDVKEINGLEGLKELTYLDISGCNCIERLPDLSLFDNLTELNIQGCSNLQDVQGLERVRIVHPPSRRGNCKASTN